MASRLVWLITGANSGFGLELSLIARASGHTVIATARNASKFPSSLKESGADLLEIEVTAPVAEITAAVTQVVKKYDRIDVLVNNAGFAQLGAVEEVSDIEARYQFDVNFFGSLNFTRAVLPYMRQQKSGIIVQLSSLAGQIGGVGAPLYGASKFAVEGLAENMWHEVKPFGVRVHIIEPGFFRTAFLNQQSKGEFVGSSIEGYEAGHAVRQMHGVQSGDPKKGAQRIYEVVTGTGMGKGKEGDLRIVLGKDCFSLVETKIRDMGQSLESSKEIAFSTDIES